MEITLKGNPINTSGELPQVGEKAKPFVLVKSDLSQVELSGLGDGKKLLNVFPSLDTGTCAASVKAFYEKLSTLDVVVCNISKDLPFAMGRFCASSSLSAKNIHELSAFRSSFAIDYGLQIVDGPLQGLCARAVIVLDSDNTVIYRQQVLEITQEPNYDDAIAALS